MIGVFSYIYFLLFKLSLIKKIYWYLLNLISKNIEEKTQKVFFKKYKTKCSILESSIDAYKK